MSILFTIFFACSSSSQEPTPTEPPQKSSPKSIQEIGAEQLYAKTQTSSPVIIDVRTIQEFQQGHIPSAKNIPLDTLTKKISELDAYKDKPIFLVCASGGRSHNAATLLTQKGFLQATNVVGGTRGWQAKGYPTER